MFEVFSVESVSVCFSVRIKTEGDDTRYYRDDSFVTIAAESSVPSLEQPLLRLFEYPILYPRYRLP